MKNSSYFFDSRYLCKDHQQPIDHINLEANVNPEKRLSCRDCRTEIPYKLMFLEKSTSKLSEYIEEDEANYKKIFQSLIIMKNNLEQLQSCIEQNLEELKKALTDDLVILNQELQKVQKAIQPEGYFNREQLEDFGDYLAQKYNQDQKNNASQEIRCKSKYKEQEQKIRYLFIEQNKTFKLNFLDDIKKKIEISIKYFQDIKNDKLDENEGMKINQISLEILEQEIQSEVVKLKCQVQEHNEQITHLDMGQDIRYRVPCFKCDKRQRSILIQTCLQNYFQKFRESYIEKYQAEKEKISEVKNLLYGVSLTFYATLSKVQSLIDQFIELDDELNSLIKQIYKPVKNFNVSEMQNFGELYFQLFYSDNQQQKQREEENRLKDNFEEEILKIKNQKFQLFSQMLDFFEIDISNLNPLRKEFLNNLFNNHLQDQLQKSKLCHQKITEAQQSFLAIDIHERYLMYQQNNSLCFLNMQQNKTFQQKINSNSKICASCISVNSSLNSSWFAIAFEQQIQLFSLIEKNGVIVSYIQNGWIPSEQVISLSAQNTLKFNYCFAVYNGFLEVLRRSQNKWTHFTRINVQVLKLQSIENFCFILIFNQETEYFEMQLIYLEKECEIEPLKNKIEKTIIDFQLFQNQNEINIVLFYPENIVYQIVEFTEKQNESMQLKELGYEVMLNPMTKETLLCSQSDYFLIVEEDVISLHQILLINRNQKEQEKRKSNFRGAFSYKKMSVVIQQDNQSKSSDKPPSKIKNVYLSHKGKYIVTLDGNDCQILQKQQLFSSLKILPNVENLLKVQKLEEKKI